LVQNDGVNLKTKNIMTTFEEFKHQVERLRAQKKEDEYVRMEVGGIEAQQISCISKKNGEDVIIVAGRDHNDLESMLIMPAGHFQIKLTFATKVKDRKEIGFKMEKGAQDENTISS
jgi:hypothetical protein